MKKRYLFMGIRAKLSISFILLTTAVMLFIDAAVFQIYRGDIAEKELVSMEDGSRILKENIGHLIDGIEENLMSEIQRCGVFDGLSDGSGMSAGSVERKMKGLGTLMHFRGVECQDIFLLDYQGRPFFYDYGRTGRTLENLREKEVYQTIDESREALFPAKGCTLWRSYPDSPDDIYIIKSYVDPVSLQYCGIICLSISKQHLRELLGEYNFGIVIYDEQGQLLYHDMKTELEQCEDSKQYFRTETSIYRRRGSWKLVSCISKREAFQDLFRLMYMLLLVELLLEIIIIYIVHRMTAGFLWNITALTDRFRRVNASDQVEEIIPHSHDETTYLCEQFEAMYHQLQENARQMVATNTLLAKSEYSALMAQMNPHFLYNSLESISSMAKLANQDQIVCVLNKLSHLLRGSLSDGAQEISLEGELKYITCYLEMQQMITGDRISWDIAVDEELLSCKVPRLILQPIVENAVIHGLDDILDDAVVIITADVRDHQLVLTVSDNGKGEEQKVLDELLAEKEVDNSQESHAHIGVRSVQKRIHILYGKEYGLTMESEPGNGMTVRICLPYGKECQG